MSIPQHFLSMKVLCYLPLKWYLERLFVLIIGTRWWRPLLLTIAERHGCCWQGHERSAAISREAAEAEALQQPWANAALFRWILATSAVQFLSGGGRLSFTCVERAAAGGHDTAVRVICMRGTVIRVPSWSSTLHSCEPPPHQRHHHSFPNILAEAIRMVWETKSELNNQTTTFGN